MRPLASLLATALLACSAASAGRPAPLAPSPAASPARLEAGYWRGARWGMTVDEVLKAFPGEAKRLSPELKLADGNVVAAGIDDWAIGTRSFRVRFVFEAGKLALVSLRTPENRPAGPEAFAELEKALGEELGPPLSRDADSALVDMRQTRWSAGHSTVDLKYIPGVVVILYHPRTDAAKP